MRLSHARSRYIYDLYYKRELISRELYDWLLKQKYADAEYVPTEDDADILVSLRSGRSKDTRSYAACDVFRRGT